MNAYDLPDWVKPLSHSLAKQFDPMPELNHCDVKVDWLTADIVNPPDGTAPKTLLVGRFVIWNERGPTVHFRHCFTEGVGLAPGYLLLCQLSIMHLLAAGSSDPASPIARELEAINRAEDDEENRLDPEEFVRACKLGQRDLAEQIVNGMIERVRLAEKNARERDSTLIPAHDALRPLVAHALRESLDMDRVVTTLMMNWMDTRPRA